MDLTPISCAEYVRAFDAAAATRPGGLWQVTDPSHQPWRGEGDPLTVAFYRLGSYYCWTVWRSDWDLYLGGVFRHGPRGEVSFQDFIGALLQMGPIVGDSYATVTRAWHRAAPAGAFSVKNRCALDPNLLPPGVTPEQTGETYDEWRIEP
jgi:hypothetical protein